MPYLEISAHCKYLSTKSIQHFRSHPGNLIFCDLIPIQIFDLRLVILNVLRHTVLKTEIFDVVEQPKVCLEAASGISC